MKSPGEWLDSLEEKVERLEDENERLRKIEAAASQHRPAMYHCSVCHQDVSRLHSCGGTVTPCGPSCGSGRLTEQRVRQIVFEELIRNRVLADRTE